MTDLPRRSFRLVCAPEQTPLVEALLAAEGFAFEPEPFSPLARRLVAEPFPLGRSQAAFWGLVYIQERSSMLPPLALAPAPGEAVLDMCASPGSKTGLLAQLVGGAGLVLGNEPGRPRLATLRANLLALNLIQAVTCSWPGEQIPLADGSWRHVLLDPPCSGWGTTDRHPGITELWRGDKIAPLITLQRRLLSEAARLLAPGGRLVYSTCTTNVEENEEQVRFAADHLGLAPEPLPAFPGFVFAPPLLPGCEGCLRVDGEASAAQGFFVACFRKPGADGTSETGATAARPGEYPSGQPEERQGERPAAHAPCEPIPSGLLADFGLDPALLPPGRIARFGDSVHFLPARAVELLPAALRWQGAAIGKAAGRGCIPSPRLRFLARDPLPSTVRLDVEDIRDLKALTQGQSLQGAIRPPDAEATPARRKQGAGGSAKEAALFWRGLPLGRLRLKNGRAVWSER